MLKLFFGSDPIGVRTAAFTYTSDVEANGKAITVIDQDSYTPGILTEVAGATSLFSTETLYILDTPSSQKDFHGDVLSQLTALADSPNEFVVIETALLAAEKKQYQKHAKTSEEFKGDKAERFNTFAMADALARKDKKSLWLLLHEARRGGIADEEIIGVLWWQLKTLQLAAKTKTASEAGLKDFPYNKAKRSLATFTAGEVERLSLSLLQTYHAARAGEVLLDEALERWTLTLG